MATTADSVVVNLEARTDQYNAKINQAAANFNKAADSIDRNSARAQNATRNLGRQVSDIGTGLATGQNPFFIIAQQSGQVADALADTGGKAAKFAAFFAGPWGAALLAAGSALGILVGEMLKTGDTVESLVAKLQDNEQKTLLAAQADRIFAGTQAGLAARIRETTNELNQQNAALRTSAQLRNVKARAEAIEASAALAAANRRVAEANKRVASFQGAGVGTDASLNAIRRENAARAAAARAEQKAALDAARQASINANRSRVFLAAEEAAAESTSQGRIAKSFDDRINALQREAIAAAESGKAIGATTKARLLALEKEKQAALDANRSAGGSSRSSGGRSGGSRRQASGGIADFNRGVRNDEAFNNELEQLNQQIITAQRQRATTAQEEADFERQTIQSEFRKRQQQIASDLKTGKYDAAQAAELNERNEYAKALKLRNVAINEDIRTLQEIAEGQRVDIGVLQESAQARLAIAETQEERKNIELELIRLKYQERKEQLEILKQQAVIRGDIQAQANINRQLEALPDLRRAEEVGVAQRNRSRYEKYRRNLDSADSLKDSIDGIKIQTLEAVTDELTNATKAALGLKGAFGDIVGELIRIGIQRKLIGPLADALFGKTGGASGSPASGGQGILTSVLTGIFSKSAKRASGGNTRGGGAYLVGENGPELFAPSGSGKIYPTGALGSPGRAGGTTIVQQSFVLDARYGITTPQLLQHVNNVASQKAAQAGRAAFEASPARYAQLDALGT